MASKAELEAEVERLRSLVKEKEFPIEVDEEISTLKEELQRVVDERDALRTQSTTLRTEKEHALEQLKKKTEELSLKSEKKVSCEGEDHVILDGVRYPILHRNMVKEFINDFYRRMVPDELFTAIVVGKIGG